MDFNDSLVKIILWPEDYFDSDVEEAVVALFAADDRDAIEYLCSEDFEYRATDDMIRRLITEAYGEGDALMADIFVFTRRKFSGRLPSTETIREAMSYEIDITRDGGYFPLVFTLLDSLQSVAKKAAEKSDDRDSFMETHMEYLDNIVAYAMRFNDSRMAYSIIRRYGIEVGMDSIVVIGKLSKEKQAQIFSDLGTVSKKTVDCILMAKRPNMLVNRILLSEDQVILGLQEKTVATSETVFECDPEYTTRYATPKFAEFLLDRVPVITFPILEQLAKQFGMKQAVRFVVDRKKTPRVKRAARGLVSFIRERRRRFYPRIQVLRKRPVIQNPDITYLSSLCTI